MKWNLLNCNKVYEIGFIKVTYLNTYSFKVNTASWPSLSINTSLLLINSYPPSICYYILLKVFLSKYFEWEKYFFVLAMPYCYNLIRKGKFPKDHESSSLERKVRNLFTCYIIILQISKNNKKDYRDSGTNYLCLLWILEWFSLYSGYESIFCLFFMTIGQFPICSFIRCLSVTKLCSIWFTLQDLIFSRYFS